MDAYLTRMLFLQKQIGQGNDKISDETLASTILAGLPSSLEQWALIKQNTPLNDIVRELREIYHNKLERTKFSNDSKEEVIAFSAKPEVKQNSNFKGHMKS